MSPLRQVASHTIVVVADVHSEDIEQGERPLPQPPLQPAPPLPSSPIVAVEEEQVVPPPLIPPVQRRLRSPRPPPRRSQDVEKAIKRLNKFLWRVLHRRDMSRINRIENVSVHY